MAGAAVTSAPVPAGRSATRTDRAHHLRRTRRWLWRTADGRAVLVLVAVPLALFVVPALCGYPAIAGDNAIQNFPLRVFSGQLVRQGHLPLWNPYIWSGQPTARRAERRLVLPVDLRLRRPARASPPGSSTSSPSTGPPGSASTPSAASSGCGRCRACSPR